MPTETAADLETKAIAAAAALKALPPHDPVAVVKEAEIVTVVTTLAALVKPFIPDKFVPVLSIAVGMILGAVGAWFAKPAPAPILIPVPAVVKPDPTPALKPTPMPEPPPAAPDAAPMQIVLYSIAGFDAAKIAADPAIKKLPVTVTVDPALYPAGSTIKSVPLPCVAHVVQGVALDAAPLASAADVIQFVTRQKK
jgi:hypothetical protein